MIENINIGICQSRLQNNLPSFFVNYKEDGVNEYFFSRSRFEIEQFKNKLLLNNHKPKIKKPMKTEITLTIDPMDPNQVAAALALFQKLSGNTVATPTVAAETKTPPAKQEKVKTEKAAKVTEPKTDEAADNQAATDTQTSDEDNNQGEVKIEEVRALLSKKVGAHRDACKAKLAALGAPNVSTLDPSKYAEFKTYLDSLA